MAFDHDQDMEQLFQGIIDSGFLPPNPEALASVINTLWLPSPGERPETLDGLLLDVLITFSTLASELVSAPELPQRSPSLVIPFVATRHTYAIADALAFLSGHADQCIPRVRRRQTPEMGCVHAGSMRSSVCATAQEVVYGIFHRMATWL